MISMVLPSQAYEVKLAPQPAPFSVLIGMASGRKLLVKAQRLIRTVARCSSTKSKPRPSSTLAYLTMFSIRSARGMTNPLPILMQARVTRSAKHRSRRLQQTNATAFSYWLSASERHYSLSKENRRKHENEKCHLVECRLGHGFSYAGDYGPHVELCEGTVHARDRGLQLYRPGNRKFLCQ